MDSHMDLKKNIKEWLLDQGYPLEMRVAAALREIGFNVIQSRYFTDPENGKAREIDVIASYPEFTGCIDVSFIIECKVSKNKPWLLFSSEHTLEGFNRLLTYCIHSKSARQILIKKGMDIFLQLRWMKKEGRTAYGVTQAFTTGDDTTFKAATSVLKAAIARKMEFNKTFGEPFLFIFPVILVDGLLFDCYLKEDGKLSIKEIDNGFYFFPWNIKGEAGTCIQIISLNNLPNFAKEAMAASDSLTSLLKNDIDKKFNEILSVASLDTTDHSDLGE